MYIDIKNMYNEIINEFSIPHFFSNKSVEEGVILDKGVCMLAKKFMLRNLG